MALPSTRLEFRIALMHVDRGLELSESVIVARHPSETQPHAILRVLAWCLLYEERLAFGPGLSTPDAPDLWTHDLTGRLVSFVECGNASAEKLRKMLQHQPGVRSHVVLDDAARASELVDEVRALKLPRGAVAPVVWTVDAALVTGLAERQERRQKWTVTIVGGHLYIDADGKALDGAVASVLV
jgi:uncharacterized protein YaeQ